MMVQSAKRVQKSDVRDQAQQVWFFAEHTRCSIGFNDEDDENDDDDDYGRKVPFCIYSYISADMSMIFFFNDPNNGLCNNNNENCQSQSQFSLFASSGE